MFNGRSVGVVFPAYNEEKHIAQATKSFLETGLVDRVIVVNNNSVDQTADKALKAGATVVNESRQGYGYALMCGLRSAYEKGFDLIMLAEPDGTFMGKDILKLLAYSDDFEFVCGTRTTKELIWDESNMKWFLRFGNIVVAKMLELLFGGPSLSDCGCTMRLISHDALGKIIDKLTVGGSHFLPETVILALKAKIPMIEIPLNYCGRIGESKITGKLKGTLTAGLNMIKLILSYKCFPRRFKSEQISSG
jgi:glycosyltransferase involved in cell wall biosynthesis